MRILVVAPFYAPSSEVPSVRMISLSDYFVKQGHQVVVLCYSKKTLLTMYKDRELSSSVPDGVKVIEFSIKPYIIPFVSDILCGKEFSKNVFNLVNPKDYDVVFTTCGPYFTLEAMPIFKTQFNVPYVLDFRDLGVLNYRPRLRSESTSNKEALWKHLIKKWYKTMIFKREEKAVMNSAHIICISQIDKEKMQNAYAIPEAKITIATNGFDENKLLSIQLADKEKGITGAVFGKFMYYSKERAVAVLSGITELYRRGIDIKLNHIGRKYDWIEPTIIENDISLECYVNCGLKEYSVGMSMLGAADFFIVEDTSPDDVGTKIYDYIFWNKPIIAAVPPEVPLAKFVRTFEHGYVCETKDDVAKALNEIIENGYDILDSDLDRMKYSRKHQNQIIENVIKKARR